MSLRVSAPRRDDGGAAVVDFVLIGTLLTFLFLALVQLCIVLYVRNVLVSAAAAGARQGANANLTTADAVAHTQKLIDAAMPGSIRPVVTSSEAAGAGGIDMVTVDVSATLPLFGLLGPAQSLHVEGHAYKEGQ